MIIMPVIIPSEEEAPPMNGNKKHQVKIESGHWVSMNEEEYMKWKEKEDQNGGGGCITALFFFFLLLFFLIGVWIYDPFEKWYCSKWDCLLLPFAVSVTIFVLGGIAAVAASFVIAALIEEKINPTP